MRGQQLKVVCGRRVRVARVVRVMPDKYARGVNCKLLKCLQDD